MDSSIEYSKAFRPCIHQHPCLTSHHYPHRRHHHHHFHVSPNCPLHSNLMLHLNIHSPACPLFNSLPFSQRESLLPHAQNLQPSDSKEAVSETQENVGLEEEEDEDPVFVLTDEWREFFAKSEAKRRQDKKQAKKKKGKK